MVSIKEAAKACGVSTATVSKALNNQPDVGSDTAICIRPEEEQDHFAVEAMLKRAFWNLNVPGCDEHYYPHIIRKHEDYIPELNLLIEEQSAGIIGSILVVKSRMYDETGVEKMVLTPGLFGIEPKYQRKGYGTALLTKIFELGTAMGYDTAVLYGNPDNYVSRGFKSCLKYRVHIPGNIYPAALMVKELKDGALKGHTWEYHESPAYKVDLSGFEEFDKHHASMKPAYQPSQEEFFIHSHSHMSVSDL